MTQPVARGRGPGLGAAMAYVAGPMRGRPQSNAPAFREAQARFAAERGWTVTTPLDTNSRVWQRTHGRPFDPTVDACDYGAPLMRALLVEDLRALVAADHVILLDGWRASRGASAEVVVACLLELPLWDAASGEAITVHPVIDFVAVGPW